MRIIEINALENGAHSNQSTNGATVLPEGWAIVPDGLEIPETFPFVDITVEEVEGVMTVTSMTAGVVPEPEPQPEPEELTVWDELDAAYKEGVNSAYDE